MVLMVPITIVFLTCWAFVDHLLGQGSGVFHGDLDHVALCLDANTYVIDTEDSY